MTQFVLSDILSIVEAHADDAAKKSERIASLDATIAALETENDRLRDGASDMIGRVENAQRTARAAAEEADWAESNADAHRENADALHERLAAASDDLNRIAATVGHLLRQHD